MTTALDHTVTTVQGDAVPADASGTPAVVIAQGATGVDGDNLLNVSGVLGLDADTLNALVASKTAILTALQLLLSTKGVTMDATQINVDDTGFTVVTPVTQLQEALAAIDARLADSRTPVAVITPTAGEGPSWIWDLSAAAAAQYQLAAPTATAGIVVVFFSPEPTTSAQSFDVLTPAYADGLDAIVMINDAHDAPATVNWGAAGAPADLAAPQLWRLECDGVTTDVWTAEIISDPDLSGFAAASDLAALTTTVAAETTRAEATEAAIPVRAPMLSEPLVEGTDYGSQHDGVSEGDTLTIGSNTIHMFGWPRSDGGTWTLRWLNPGAGQFHRGHLGIEGAHDDDGLSFTDVVFTQRVADNSSQSLGMNDLKVSALATTGLTDIWAYTVVGAGDREDPDADADVFVSVARIAVAVNRPDTA